MSKKRKSLVGHNTSSEQTTWLRSKWNSINCKNTVKQCEKLSYSYWFIDRDFDDLSNGDYSQQSIALIAIILVSAIIALLIPFAECVPRPSFLYLYCCLTPTGPLIFSNIWLFLMIISSWRAYTDLENVCTQIWKMILCSKMYFHKWTNLWDSQSKNLWIARGSLPSSCFDHSSTIWYILPPLLCGIIMSESVFLIMSEKTVFVKFIR